MKISMKVIAAVVAATLVSGSMASPASAFFFGPPKFFFHFPKFPKFPHKPYTHVKKAPQVNSHGSNGFPWAVACVMGSALGLISASVAKATAAGQPPSWLSQVEYERTRNNNANHLTSSEAAGIGFSCGLGALPVIANNNR
jgi:hypothetical protein